MVQLKHTLCILCILDYYTLYPMCLLQMWSIFSSVSPFDSVSLSSEMCSLLIFGFISLSLLKMFLGQIYYSLWTRVVSLQCLFSILHPTGISPFYHLSEFQSHLHRQKRQSLNRRVGQEKNLNQTTKSICKVGFDGLFKNPKTKAVLTWVKAKPEIEACIQPSIWRSQKPGT